MVNNKTQESTEKECIEAKESRLGSLLCKARKSKGYSIEEVSDHTKLSQQVIYSLENDRFADIGASVYVRGYISIYAKYLNLDVNEMLELYDNETPLGDTKINPHVANGSNIFSLKKKRKRSAVVVGFFIFLFLILVGYIYMDLVEPMVVKNLIGTQKEIVQVNNKSANNNLSPDKSSANESLQIQLPLVEETKKVLDNANRILNNEPTQDSESLIPLHVDSANYEPDTLVKTERSNDSQTINDNAVSNEVTSDANQNNLPSGTNEINTSETNIQSIINTTSEIKTDLVIKANQENWVEIRNNDKKIIYSKIMKKGEFYSINIDKLPITIKTANIDRLVVNFNDGDKIDLEKHKQTKNTYLIKNN